MAATIKDSYPGLYSITSSIEEGIPCAAEIRALWEAKRTSGEAVDRVDPTPLTQLGHPMAFAKACELVPDLDHSQNVKVGHGPHD
jgi:hypothetical protein